MKSFTYKNIEITHLKHSSFKIKYNNLVTYIDPYQIEDEPADYILITHDHYDHFDPDSINSLKKTKTIFIFPQFMTSQFTGNIHGLLPGEYYHDENITINTVPMYNFHHAREKNFLAYILELNETRIFHAGDSGPTIEIKALQNIDIALMPIDGKFTMSEIEVADLVKKFKPKIVIPMHYGEISGGGDPNFFKKLVENNTQVETLD